MQLRTEINLALATIAQKHNLLIDIGNGRFSATECRFTKLVIRPKTAIFAAPLSGANNAPILSQTLEGQEYLNLGYLLGLPKDGLGKTFICAGKRYVITGLRRSRRKYPVSGISSTGKPMKFTTQSVIAGLKMAAVAQSLVK